ncbi:hypothetical protein AB7783_04525 [Tardiphaga sp. 172_B4_N1_3]|uniref:hypothetical protein n=1 Tax=Tardiphaga sp. 172_B4_N1_3 TaxID=3240787 RepID=UPI003F88D937
MVQHVSSDNVQNAEASQDSDCPRFERRRRRRWSTDVGALGNCHIQISFLHAFGKFDCHFESALLLPTAEFKIGCSSASSWGERYRWVHTRAIRQMSYFVVGKEANVEKPCAAADGGAVGDQRGDAISTVAG